MVTISPGNRGVASLPATTWSSITGGDQPSERYAQGSRQLLSRAQRRIADAPFDPADVGAVKARQLGQRLLREAQLRTSLADTTSKGGHHGHKDPTVGR